MFLSNPSALSENKPLFLAAIHHAINLSELNVLFQKFLDKFFGFYSEKSRWTLSGPAPLLIYIYKVFFKGEHCFSYAYSLNDMCRCAST